MIVHGNVFCESRRHLLCNLFRYRKLRLMQDGDRAVAEQYYVAKVTRREQSGLTK